MTEPRKKPGVAFWATVVVVLLLAYPVSFGPATWLYDNGGIPASAEGALEDFYEPVIWARDDDASPRWLRRSVNWYEALWIWR